MDIALSGARCKILICGGQAIAATNSAMEISATDDVSDKWRGDVAKLVGDFILAMNEKLAETYSEPPQ